MPKPRRSRFYGDVQAGSDPVPSRDQVVREIILQSLFRDVPKTTNEVVLDVQSEYGSVNERTVLRHLRHLTEAGFVKKTTVEDIYGYVKISTSCQRGAVV